MNQLPSQDSAPILLVADAHVKAGTLSEERFRQMLSWLETTRYDIAFLGDVMELWIGLPAYEDALQREFLDWCRRETARRRIYFLEGNHEFFVLKYHRNCFSESAPDTLQVGPELLSHGDSQAASGPHRCFRWWSKSPLAHFLLRFLPGAPAIVRAIKRGFEKKSRTRAWRFPAVQLSSWGQGVFAKTPSCQAILLGHFHRPFQLRCKGNRLLAVLPAWKDHGEVAIFDPLKNTVFFHHWRSLS